MSIRSAQIALSLLLGFATACGSCKDDPEEPGDPIGMLLIEICDNAEDDDGDGLRDCEERECQLKPACVVVPDEPVAPPPPRSGIANFADSVRFLWEGDGAPIRGLDPAALDEGRVAVIRGRVLDTQGAPVGGVHASIAGRPDLGYTYSRQDGAIDLVANGGRDVVVRWESASHPAVDRVVSTIALDYSHPPAVVMTPYDEAGTSIDLKAGGTHVATASNDADGSRAMRLYFPPDTTARVVEPNGRVTNIDAITVRASEFTVGDMGADAMPADLPAMSAYTYAVELSVDEAREVGAQTVEFTRPVSLFLDNFLDLPVGAPVPNGLYDRGQSAWQATRNGVVAKLVAGGIDVDGDDVADSANALTELGHNAAGVVNAAKKFFEAGDTFWLAAVPHFTPCDLNFPFEWPAGSVDPDIIYTPLKSARRPCTTPGSAIECQSQVLTKAVAVPGTDLELNYRSDRVEGRGRGFELELTGDTLGPDIEFITVDVELAGRNFHDRYEPAPHLTHEFQWDGLDAYGREVTGKRTVRITVSYWYDVNYMWPPDDIDGFGRLGTSAELREGRLILPRRTRQIGQMGGLNARTVFGLGGWQLSAQHAWDANSRTFYPGGGAPERSSADVSKTVRNFETFQDLAGTLGFDPRASGTAAGPNFHVYADGSLLILFRYPNSGVFALWRRDPAGGWALVSDLSGTEFFEPAVTVHPNGDIFVSSRRCVWRVGGELEAVAGTCVSDDAPYGFPVEPNVSISPNGRVFVSTFDEIYEIFPDERRAELFAGCQSCDPAVIGGSARTSNLGGADIIQASRRGIYFTSRDANTIRFVDWSGRYDLAYAGADSSAIRRLAIDSEDALHFMEIEGITGGFIKRLQDDGTAATVVGSSPEDLLAQGVDVGAAMRADGVPASSILLTTVDDIGFDARGRLFYSAIGAPADAELIVPLIKVVESAYGDSISANELIVPSRHGDKMYIFDRQGRIVETRNALTGAPLHSFEYEGGLLARVVDADIGAIEIERGGAGDPAAIVAPGGVRTEFALEPAGHIATITYPDARAVAMASSDGLITSWTSGGDTTTYEYDRMGRLTRMVDALGGWKQFTLTNTGVRYESSAGSSREWMGDTTVRTRHDTDWDIEHSAINDGRRVVQSDGTILETALHTDPRFGPQAQFLGQRATQTPSGLRQEMTATREYQYADPADLSSVSHRTETSTVNGSTTVKEWDVATHTLTVTSPEGRMSRTVFDDQGRPTSRQIGDYTATRYNWFDDNRASRIEHGNRWIAAERDASGFVIAQSSAGGESVSFTNDAFGRVVSATHQGATWMNEYGDAGLIAQVDAPMSSATVTLDWDHRQRLASHSVPGAGANTFEWNIDDTVITHMSAGGTTTTVELDDKGRPVREVSGVETVTRDWDPTTSMVTRVASLGAATEFMWDGFLIESTRHTVGPADVTVTRTRNNNFQTTRFAIGSIHIDHAYDLDGLRTRAGALAVERGAAGEVVRTEAGVVDHEREYDADGILTAERYYVSGALTYEWAATIDLSGRITSVTESVDGASTTREFAYDTLGRLSAVDENAAPAEQYGWAAESQRVLANGAVGEFDASGRLRLHGATSLTYDAGGNVARMDDGVDATDWAYDSGQAKTAAGAFGSVEFTHDGMGKRVGMSRGGVFERGWIYDGDDLVAQLNASGNVEMVFVYSTQPHVPDLVVKGGVTYRLLTDWRGAVRAAVDISSGAVAQRRDCDAFGVQTAGFGDAVQPFAFAGGLDVGVPGVLAFASRMYAPSLGRWLQPDPAGLGGAGVDLWAYTVGDPINFIDRDGEWVQLVTIAGFLVGVPALAWGYLRVDPMAQDAADDAVKMFNWHRDKFKDGCIGTHNGPGDAVKHCTLSCETSRQLPSATARMIQFAHELKGAGQSLVKDGMIPFDEHFMDFDSNDCGNSLAEEQPERNCYALCAEAFFNGRLKTLPMSTWNCP